MRSLAVAAMLGLVGVYACSSDDTGGVAAGSGDAGASSSSGDAAGGSTSSGSSGGTVADGAASPDATSSSSGGTLLGPVSLTLDGLPADIGAAWYQNPVHKGTNISFVIGQAIGTAPKEASILVEVQLDPAKTGTGTYADEAVINVNALLSIFQGPKKGTYSQFWSPEQQKGITFKLAVADKKITLSWKGVMTIGGGTTTVDVDAEAKDAALK